jgi:cob(I)alamin adenosyltransferase
MGNRLTQIATRTGDDGTTGLGDNRRVSKNSLRVHAMGEVDELNSHIGVLLCEQLPERVRELLIEVQHQLFNLGGELSIPGFELLKAEAVLALDHALADHNETLPKLQIRVVDPPPHRLLPLSPPNCSAAPPPGAHNLLVNSGGLPTKP